MPFSSAASKIKYRAHLPCAFMPEDIFYHGLDPAPLAVLVTTDNNQKAKIQPLSVGEQPPCITRSQTKYYQDALAMAQQGITLVCVLKDCGIHQQTLYACPVMGQRGNGTSFVAGALVALDSPSAACCPVAESAQPMCEDEKKAIQFLLDKEHVALSKAALDDALFRNATSDKDRALFRPVTSDKDRALFKTVFSKDRPHKTASLAKLTKEPELLVGRSASEPMPARWTVTDV